MESNNYLFSCEEPPERTIECGSELAEGFTSKSSLFDENLKNMDSDSPDDLSTLMTTIEELKELAEKASKLPERKIKPVRAKKQDALSCDFGAERAVIIAMMKSKAATETAIEMLSIEDFTSKENGLIFASIEKIYKSSESKFDNGIEQTTLIEQLASDGASLEVQTPEFLNGFFDLTPMGATVNVEKYAAIVKDKAAKRKLIKVLEGYEKKCKKADDSYMSIFERHKDDIANLEKNSNFSDSPSLEDKTIQVFNKIVSASENKKHITGLETGFRDLDNWTTGFHSGDFILLAARPSMGKTAFALNILEYVGIKKHRPCIFFSLEMNKGSLINRLLSMNSGINAQTLRTGELQDEDWGKLEEAAKRVGSGNIVIDDTSAITAREIRERAKRVKNERGLDLIVIDYLQFMSGTNRNGDSRQQEISDISRELKSIARELGCPVLALSQLSRAVELRNPKIPILSDLRDSGAIEQDADIVMFLYRDEYYNKEDIENKGKAQLIIAKQRNGPVGTIDLAWLADTTRFMSLEK